MCIFCCTFAAKTNEGTRKGSLNFIKKERYAVRC